MVKSTSKVAKVKTPKIYRVECRQHRNNHTIEFQGTLEYLIKDVFGYTLECGASWQHQKGNSKINTNPNTIGRLIDNLNKAVNNSASNGYAGKNYSEIPIVIV